METLVSKHISLDQYHIFYTAARVGSMSGAARELFISQPAVSMAISRLERSYGGKLFIRSKGGIRPTAEGKMLFEHLEKAFSLIDEAERLYVRMRDLNAGELPIGASDTLSMKYLLPYLERFHREYPRIRISLTNRTTNETISLIRGGFAEIGFVNLPYRDAEDMEIYPCMEIHDCLIGGTRYEPLRSGISLKDICKYPLIMLEKESNTRRFIDKTLGDRGISVKPHIELGSSDLLVKFAGINLGLAFVIREFYLQELISGDSGVFEIPVEDPFPARQIGAVYRKNTPLSQAAHKLLEIIRTAPPVEAGDVFFDS